MASVQSTISFPARKRFSVRANKKAAADKENNSSPVKDDLKPSKKEYPTKRLSCNDKNIWSGDNKKYFTITKATFTVKKSDKELERFSDNTLNENGASPPKVKINGLGITTTSVLNDVTRDLTRSLSDKPADKIGENKLNQEETVASCNPANTENKGQGNTELIQAIRVLHSSQPTKIYGRDNKVDEITSLLLHALNNKESTTLYISGPPGTGKSACVNHIISQPQISGCFKSVYVNCTGLKTANAAYKKIAKTLGLKNESSDKKTQLSIEKYLRTNQKMILLVLDEMDQLESKKQSLLYTIFEWPSLYQSNLVLIGIANALDLTDRVLPRLQAKLDIVPKLIHFPPYSREEIIDILTSRLKEGEVDSVLNGGALQLLASKVAAVSGDIRKALDIGRRVIEIAQNKSDSGKQVALLDVLSVVNNVYGTSVSLDNNSEGESFPLHQKLLICVMVLIKKNSKVKEVTIGRLHDVYRRVCVKNNLNFLELSEFISLTELVESRGVIRIIGKTKNRLSKVVLLWDECEISTALQDKKLLATVLDDVSCLK